MKKILLVCSSIVLVLFGLLIIIAMALGPITETVLRSGLPKFDVGEAQTLLQETGAKTGESLKEVIDAASQPLKNLGGFFK